MLKPLKTTLDWKAYFKEFCRIHGEPVRWGRRLLFPDGWSYAALDHRGPEWPPPARDADRAMLLRKYWEIRMSMVRDQRIKLETDIKGLDETARARSAPLQERALIFGEDGAKLESRPLDLQALTERLVWLAEEQTKCAKELAALNEQAERHTHDRQRQEADVHALR